MAQNGQFAGNLQAFCRLLRASGMPVASGQVRAAFRALTLIDLSRREDVFVALRATLVTDANHLGRFSSVFAKVFEGAELWTLPASEVPPDSSGPVASAPTPVASPGFRPQADAEPASEDDNGAVDGGSSTVERLAHKDFESMSADELRRVTDALRRIELSPPAERGRRYESRSSGDRVDLRQSIRDMRRSNNEFVRLAKKRRRTRQPDVVLLCDVSASMSAYSRLFLHFAHATTARRPGTRTFVFATRLTEISQRLRARNVDEALAGVASGVQDMDGGTRIAESLAAFNRLWLRRLPLHEATVVLLSDGLERDTESDLEFQMARLHRSCRHLIWLNPLLRYAQFKPRAYGIRTMLPHVDTFLPAHSLDSLRELAIAVARGVRGGESVAS